MKDKEISKVIEPLLLIKNTCVIQKSCATCPYYGSVNNSANKSCIFNCHPNDWKISEIIINLKGESHDR